MPDLPIPDEVAHLGLTEKSDFSIFLKYPDIDFDPESDTVFGPGPAIDVSSHAQSDGPGPALENSSPGSHGHNYDTDSASRSCSTPYTTPRRLVCENEEMAGTNEYREYLAQLSLADLGTPTRRFYCSLADKIILLSAYLQPRTLYLSATTTQDVLRDSSPLLSQLQEAIKVVCYQVSAMQHITSLAPFTITPTDLALTSIYRQRASLVLTHLTLPSSTEHQLLDNLLPVFDAYIYSPYLLLPRHHFSSTCADRINSLYNYLNALITTYTTWLRLTRSLKETYFSPLLRRIQESNWVRKELDQFSEALAACDRLNSRPFHEVISSNIDDEQVKGAEQLAERRTKSSMALKERRRATVAKCIRTRVRREHTL